jgi:hypothetical protein
MKSIITLSLALLCLQNVYAWGPEGHMIVGKIAEEQLSPAAKLAVSKLLPGTNLAAVSTWADQIKDQPAWVQTKPWHFIDVADGRSYESITHAPEGDVITAIDQYSAVLKDSTSSTLDRQNALKFLVHFVGDIHQPLHVGRPNDHGGNMIKVLFEGRKTNLHQLWDSGMILQQNMDYVQYAHYLQTHGPASFKKFTEVVEIPYKQIITDDMAARAEMYKFAKALNGTVTLDAAYMNRNITTMNTQLLQGGKRLAALLNSIFGSKASFKRSFR